MALTARPTPTSAAFRSPISDAISLARPLSNSPFWPTAAMIASLAAAGSRPATAAATWATPSVIRASTCSIRRPVRPSSVRARSSTAATIASWTRQLAGEVLRGEGSADRVHRGSDLLDLLHDSRSIEW